LCVAGNGPPVDCPGDMVTTLRSLTVAVLCDCPSLNRDRKGAEGSYEMTGTSHRNVARRVI